MHPTDVVGEELWSWITTMPGEMLEQIHDNCGKIVAALPEHPEALNAAWAVARMNLSLTVSMSEQIGGDSVDESDSIWRVLAGLALQNLELMLAIDDIKDPNWRKRNEP
jgi:hypothetical protein